MSRFLIRFDGAELELVMMVLFEQQTRVMRLRPREASQCQTLRMRLMEAYRERQVRNWPPRGWVQPTLPDST